MGIRRIIFKYNFVLTFLCYKIYFKSVANCMRTEVIFQYIKGPWRVRYSFVRSFNLVVLLLFMLFIDVFLLLAHAHDLLVPSWFFFLFYRLAFCLSLVFPLTLYYLPNFNALGATCNLKTQTHTYIFSVTKDSAAMF